MGISEFFQLPVNRLVFSLLPPRLSYAYLLLVGKVYFLLRPEERRLIVGNIRDVLGQRRGNDELKRITRATFRGIFHHYAEKLFQAYHQYGNVVKYIEKKVSFSGMERIDQALERGKGVLLVTGHFGGVEFLPTVLALRRYNPHMVVNYRTPELKRSLEERADRVGMVLIDAQEGNLFFRLTRILRENRVLITECDEVEAINPQTAGRTDMFGVPVCLDRSIDMMQRKTGAEVLGVFLVRKGLKGYQLRVEALDADGRESASCAASVLHLLEKYILQYPEQWYQWKGWRRWRAGAEAAIVRTSSRKRRREAARDAFPDVPAPTEDHRMPGAAA